jgi:L-aminopeptidase/D-esterase-like protein
MDAEACQSCLRAVRLVARSARLCAVTDPESPQYAAAVDSALRMIDRAQSYFKSAKGERASTEREVRLVLTAVVEARSIVTALASSSPLDTEDLQRMAGKVERAIARAGGSEPPPDPV